MTSLIMGAEDDPGFEQVDLKNVPEVVTRAVRNAFPDYVIDEAILEKDGSEIYSLALNHKTKKKQSASIVVDSKGVVYGKIVDVKSSEVPAEVLKAVHTKYKGIVIQNITHDKDLIDGKWTEEYSVDGSVEGRSRYLRVSSAGNIISDLSQEEYFGDTVITEEE